MTDVGQLLQTFGVCTNKSLGQHFLHRADVIDAIADAAGSGECCLEIGAGPGVLSDALCERFGRVMTVEIDRSLQEMTAQVLKDRKNHRMIYADFLKLDLPEMLLPHAPVTVVGNLPYNITGQIVTRLLKHRALFDKGVIMVQKEAAQKLCAVPSTKEYRAISVLTQFFCEITPLFDVSADCFIPPPHVQSTVLSLDFKRQAPLTPEREAAFFAFVQRIFSARRKMLTSVFHQPEEKQNLPQAFKTLGLRENTRGETLSPDTLYLLFEQLYPAVNEC